MLELPKALNADWQPLTWHSYRALDGKQTAYINDGNDYLNLKNHTIDSDGTVHPSVGCPVCGFHEFVKLLGWNE